MTSVATGPFWAVMRVSNFCEVIAASEVSGCWQEQRQVVWMMSGKQHHLVRNWTRGPVYGMFCCFCYPNAESYVKPILKFEYNESISIFKSQLSGPELVVCWQSYMTGMDLTCTINN